MDNSGRYPISSTDNTEPEDCEFENLEDDKELEYPVYKIPLGTIRKRIPRAIIQGHTLVQEYPHSRYDYTWLLQRFRKFPPTNFDAGRVLSIETGVPEEFPDPCEFHMVPALRISCLTPAWIEYINQMTNLEELKIEFKPFQNRWREPDYAAAIAALPPDTDTALHGPLGIDLSQLSLSNLKKLEIKTDPTLYFLTSVPPLPNCPNITELTIDGGKITSMDSLKSLNLPKLRVLSLKRLEISNVDHLWHFPSLQMVDLFSNPAPIRRIENFVWLGKKALSEDGLYADARALAFLKWIRPYCFDYRFDGQPSANTAALPFFNHCKRISLLDLFSLYENIESRQQILLDLPPTGWISDIDKFSREIAFIVQHHYRRAKFLSTVKTEIGRACEGVPNWFKELANQNFVNVILQNEYILPVLDYALFHARANEFSNFLSAHPGYELPPLVVEQFVDHAPEGLRRFVLGSLETPPRLLIEALIAHSKKRLSNSDFSII